METNAKETNAKEMMNQEPPSPNTSTNPGMDLQKWAGIVEGLLFASGEKISLSKIAETIGKSKMETREILSHMFFLYQSTERGITLREIGDGFLLCTKPEIYEWLEGLFSKVSKQSLSQAAFETLAIIAYNGPVTKHKIEQLRGVSSESALVKLKDRALIYESGRLDAPGRPVTFDVTEEFFRQFGFSSKKDLPVLEMEDLINKASQ